MNEWEVQQLITDERLKRAGGCGELIAVVLLLCLIGTILGTVTLYSRLQDERLTRLELLAGDTLAADTIRARFICDRPFREVLVAKWDYKCRSR